MQARNVRPTYLPRVSSLNNTFHDAASHGPKGIGSHSNCTWSLQPHPLASSNPTSPLRENNAARTIHNTLFGLWRGANYVFSRDNEDSGMEGGLEVIPARRGPGRQKCKSFLGGRAGSSAGMSLASSSSPPARYTFLHYNLPQFFKEIKYIDFPTILTILPFFFLPCVWSIKTWRKKVSPRIVQFPWKSWSTSCLYTQKNNRHANITFPELQIQSHACGLHSKGIFVYLYFALERQ